MAGFGSLVSWGMTSVDGLMELVVGMRFGLQAMVGVCLGVLVGVREAGLIERFVHLGFHCKRGFSPMDFAGLWVGLGLGIEFLETHL